MDKKRNKVLSYTNSIASSSTMPEEGLCNSNRRMSGSKKTIRFSRIGTENTQSYSTDTTDKKTPLQLLYADDMRISKILRRLSNENSPTAAADLCQKLELAVRDPSNSAYINRSFDLLAETITSILKQEPKQCFNHLAKIFGILGYIIRLDFPIYKNWITKNYKSSKSIRNYMMISLKTTFSCDAVNQQMKHYSDRLLVLLKEYLENADLADNFVAVSDAIAEFSKNYNKSFEKHFTDIVDIIIGWHLEVEQSHDFKQHCSNVLQQFSVFFVRQYTFTFRLLGQFLEDIHSFSNDKIQSVEMSEKAGVAPEISYIGSYIGAFNSVTKCLVDKDEFVAFSMGSKIYQDAIEIITSVALKCFYDIQCMDTVCAVNEFFTIIINIEPLMELEDLTKIINLQIKNVKRFDETAVGSLLFLMLSVIHRTNTTTPIQILEFVMNPKSPLATFKISKKERSYKIVLKIYHEILLIKNVVILQEAYKYLLEDVRCIINIFQDRTNQHRYTIPQAECLLNFYCSALSILAIQTSSIMAKYVLNPSILKLFINECKLADMKIWVWYPNLHGSLMNLLSLHCQKNRNYLLSSSLLKDSFFSKLSPDDSSPTSENLVIILQFMRNVLAESAILSKDTLKLVISWTKGIHIECTQYALNLIDNEFFTEIGELICATSLIEPMDCASVIHVLQTYSVLNKRILIAIRDATLHHMCSLHKDVRDTYTNIFGKLPLSTSLNRVYTDVSVFNLKAARNQQLLQWYLSSSTTTELKDKNFKEIMELISRKDTHKTIDTFLNNIYPKCHIVQSRIKSVEFFDAVSADLNLLLTWAQWASAEYCVKTKLRTSLGKPQETFLKIESVIKEFARILALKEYGRLDNIECLITNGHHGKFLLGFLECLEKAIYNAAEGTAFALSVAEKPSKAFFRVNASTCNEWFNRIRTATNLVGLHCMEPEMVIRYSEVMLKSLIASGRTNDVLLEHTLMSYVWALYRCGESESLHGLYAWVRIKTGRKFIWIKCVADHSDGYREKATEGYANILNAKDTNLDIHVREFLQDQLVECLFLTAQWDELDKYIASVDGTKRETAPRILMNHSQLQAIRLCQQDIDSSIMALTEWKSFDHDIDSFDNNFSYYNMLNQNEKTLMGLALKGEFSFLDQVQLENCTKFIQAGLQECIRSSSKEHTNDFILLNHIAQRIHLSQNGSPSDNTFNIDKNHDSSILFKVMFWSDVLSHREENRDANSSLLLDVATTARRDDNLQLCHLVLKRFFKRKGVNMDLCKISASILNGRLSQSIEDADLLRGYLEICKWLYKQPSRQNEAIEFAASGCLHFYHMPNQTYESTIKTDISKMFIKLSEWLSGRNEENAVRLSAVHKLIGSLPDFQVHPDSNVCSVIPDNEIDVGKILLYSVTHNSNLAMCVSAFGNWCYRWGKKIVEAKNEDKAGLSDRDIDEINLSIPLATESDIEQIVNVLNQHQVNTTDDEEIGSSEISSTELVEIQLRQIEVLTDSPDVIFKIIRIWRNAYRSIYNYYEMAADAYFKYLNLATNESLGDCSIVTATLRLLRLVVKHALGLQEVLEAGLSSTSTRPWKVIIPQLFSRLNHHEPYVRKRVSELLCRVAMDSPHLIIFPAVVGAVHEDKESFEANPLTTCFNSLLQTLSHQTPHTVEQVQLLVKELKRVTLLWEEFWMHSLAQLYSEYNEVFNAFESEVRNSNEDHHETIQKKHEIIIRYLTKDMEKLQSITSRTYETNHERNFQEKYCKTIEMAIKDLQKPLNLLKPNESWQKIKQLYGIFQQRMQKNSQSALKMIDISPILANLSQTAISMPGVETSENNPIFITSVDASVFILPTKTKPKKLAFHGNDGQKYTYLFKGLEDLHLDERIMQFLSISNSMMTRSADLCNNSAKYKAHHYSVIPLGPRSGLISWVNGVTPLFALYKKWQQRESSNPKKDKLQQTAVMRPSEMFFNKLAPLLAERNIKTTENRKSWPLSVLRKVLEELTKETPSDLLAKELWCQSHNCATWRESIRTYSNSVAVMSVIGYVIGLGDRHLDNVLVNLTTGEIVHIDYNVCFEKGKTLRVPEKVPFRMTQNLSEALGVTGIEGTFRLTCEHVLKTLRKERETLLTMLEAFVYDPLVDWPTSDDGSTSSTCATKAADAAAEIATLSAASVCPSGGAPLKLIECSEYDRRQCKKRHELDAMRCTLISRFTAIKPDWEHYKMELSEKLKEVLSHLDDLELYRKNIQEHENKRDLLSKQMAMVVEVDMLRTAMASHPLNSISQRYGIYRKAKDELCRIKEIVANKVEELCTKKDLYFNEVLGFEIDENNQLTQQLHNSNIILHGNNEFTFIKDILESGTQGQLYIQANQCRNELNSSHVQQDAIIQVALDSIRQYCECMRFYAKPCVQNHPFIKYGHWLSELLAEPSKASEIKELIITVENGVANDLPASDTVLAYAVGLEKFWLEINFSLRKKVDLLKSQNTFYALDQIINDAQKSIADYLQQGPSALLALKCAVFNTSCVIMNNTCITDVNTIESFFDEQIKFPSSLLVLTNIVNQTNSAQLLSDYKSVIESLKELQTVFQIRLPFMLISCFMKQQDMDLLNEISDLQDEFDFDEIVYRLTTSKYDTYIESIVKGYEPILSQATHSNIGRILLEIETLFKEFMNRLENLLYSISDLQMDDNLSSTDCMLLLTIKKDKLLQSFKSDGVLDLLLVKKIETITLTVAIARRMSSSLINSNLQEIYNLNDILEPVTEFVRTVESKIISSLRCFISSLLKIELIHDCNILPLISNMDVENLRDRSIEYHLSAMSYTLDVYNFAEKMCDGWLRATEKSVVINNTTHSIEILTEQLKHYGYISTVHFWMNETLLVNRPPFGHIIYRNTILQTVQRVVKNLKAWKYAIDKIKEELSEIHLAVDQRLKWSVGANPSLSGLQQSFDICRKYLEEHHETKMALSAKIIHICNSIAVFESMQIDNTKICELGREITLLLNQLSDCYTIERNHSSMITDVERAIVELLDPEGDIDQCWINNISGLFDEITNTLDQKIAASEKSIYDSHENLVSSAKQLQILMDTQLRIDVRYIIKLITKIENAHNMQSPRAKIFQANYKQLLEKFSVLHVNIICPDYKGRLMAEIRSMINGLLEEIEVIFENFVKLVEDRSVPIDEKVSSEMKEKNDINTTNNFSTPLKETKKGFQPEQKRNAYAVSVWRRVRMKLEGRDPDPNRRLSVAEQVDCMIREAMNPDNLSVLYEGWTPWV